MRMELIQPFINAADAVLAESLQCETRIGDVSMEEETYRRKGDLERAIQAYNQVIEGYKENTKTPDAFYMKGVTLSTTMGPGVKVDAGRLRPQDEAVPA